MLGTEIIIMGASALFTSLLGMWKQAKEDAHERLMASIRMDEINAKAIISSNELAGRSKGFNLTRNMLALWIVGGYLFCKWYMAVNNIPIYVAEEYTKGGFSFFGVTITKPETGIRFSELYGLVILPIDYHLLFAVIGAYFGYVCSRRGR